MKISPQSAIAATLWSSRATHHPINRATIELPNPFNGFVAAEWWRRGNAVAARSAAGQI